jgi:hypothetical protein
MRDSSGIARDFAESFEKSFEIFDNLLGEIVEGLSRSQTKRPLHGGRCARRRHRTGAAGQAYWGIISSESLA